MQEPGEVMESCIVVSSKMKHSLMEGERTIIRLGKATNTRLNKLWRLRAFEMLTKPRNMKKLQDSHALKTTAGRKDSLVELTIYCAGELQGCSFQESSPTLAWTFSVHLSHPCFCV